MSSPRGFFIDRYDADDPRTFSRRYIYTYIHHKTESDLRLSADAGCDVCKAISASLERKLSAALSRASTPRSQCDSAIQPSKGADTAEPGGSDLGGSRIDYDPEEEITEKYEPGKYESDKDDWEPSKLADFVKQQPGLREAEDIFFHCQGRVLIQHRFDEKTGLESDSSITVSGINSPFPHHIYPRLESLYHFSTPCTLILSHIDPIQLPNS